MRDGTPTRAHRALPVRRMLGGFPGWAWWLVALFALLCHAFWEGHGLFDPAFRNPNVAGIAYNARLLASGALPYVASSDIKPPGAFFLFTPLLDLGGMRAVWGMAVFWGASLSIATGILAELVWGRGAGLRAVMLHALCAAVASDADINYSFWMAAPFTLSAACACHATRVLVARRANVSWALCGALAMLAVAIKPSAWPLALLFAALLGREVLRGNRKRAALGALSGAGGAVVVAALVALPYAVFGEFGALAAGMRDVSTFGNEYVAAVRDPSGGRLPAILRGLPCFAEQMPGPMVLAALGLGGLFSHEKPRAPLALGAYAFLVAAFVGTTFTLRFFSHDNAELWPALAVIAVRPAGVLGRALDGLKAVVGRLRGVPHRVRALAVPAVTLAVGVAAAWPGFESRWGYVHWMAERDHEVHAICDGLSDRLPPGEPVLAWGWNAWSVYEHCQRRAPGRVFKVIASVTSVNTNTCNAGFGPMVLRNDAGPSTFLEEVVRHPPSLLLWSTYFEEMGGDPLDGWAALKTFIGERYVAVEARGPFVALLRSDLVDGKPGASAQLGASSFEASGSGTYGWSARAGSVWTSTSRTPENLPLMASMTQCVTR